MTKTSEGFIKLHWQGPFAWPGVHSKRLPDLRNNPQIASESGIYLWTVEHANGYLIYAAGITRRSFVKRFQEHTRSYRSGVYTIFDVELLKKGIRGIIWSGFWFKKQTPEIKHEYKSRNEEIRNATEHLLANYCIFIAPLPPAKRVLERIEAAIMNNLYTADGPASAIPDRGMALSPRYRDEPIIHIHNISPVAFHGLPEKFEA